MELLAVLAFIALLAALLLQAPSRGEAWAQGAGAGNGNLRRCLSRTLSKQQAGLAIELGADGLGEHGRSKGLCQKINPFAQREVLAGDLRAVA